MSLAAIGETIGMSSKSIGSLLTKNDPKALTCKGFLCEDVRIEGSNKPATLAKSPGVALLWLIVAESNRIDRAKRDRAASLLAAFTADKLEDVHSHAWGKVRMHQESQQYRTETQQHIETALGLYHIWGDILEHCKSSATIPNVWSGKPSNKERPGVILTEGMWQKLAHYGKPFIVKVKVLGKERFLEMCDSLLAESR